MKRSIPLASGLAALVVLFWLFGFDEIGHALRVARPEMLAVYLALALVVLFGYSARWRLVTTALGRTLPWRRLVAARLGGDAVGWLVPSAKLAGEPVRAGLVMREGVGAPEAGAGVAIDRLMEVTGNMVSVLAYVAVFSLARAGGSTALLAAAGMLVGLGSLFVLVLLLRGGRRPFSALYGARARRALPRLAPFMEGLSLTEDHLQGFFRDHPRAFLRGALFSLVIEALIIVEYHFLLRSFGIEIGVPVLLLVVLGSGLARALPTPAALGSLEASQVAVLGLAAGAPAEGLVVGIVLRLHETLWIAVGLAVLAATGFSRRVLGASAEGDGVAA